MENTPTPLEKTVIDNIRRIRQEKKISQLRLSIFCGTSASYIGLMETYKNIPKLSTIERIAEALNVPVLELFTPVSEINKNIPEEEKKDNEQNEQLAKRQKLREQLKSEIMNSIECNLDNILQII
ncbi:MAG: helix-turn-helix domain-containing protein [Treponema sp.]|nr:helix-turn-helix domain-containing protein [Treponema sp.]